MKRTIPKQTLVKTPGISLLSILWWSTVSQAEVRSNINKTEHSPASLCIKLSLGTHFSGKIYKNQTEIYQVCCICPEQINLNFLTTTFSKILAIICHFNCYEEKLDFFFKIGWLTASTCLNRYHLRVNYSEHSGTNRLKDIFEKECK